MENNSKQNWVTLVLGILIIGFAIYRYYQDEAFMKHVGVVNGTVKKISIDRNVKNSEDEKYTAHIYYEVNGKTYETSDYSNGSQSPWQQGEAVALNYNLDDPGEVRIAAQMKQSVLWAAAAGLFLVAFACYSFIKKKKNNAK
jgi:hypothetical protein